MNIKEVKTIKLNKDDIIVLKFDEVLSDAEFNYLHKYLDNHFPNNKHILAGKGVEVEKLEFDKESESILKKFIIDTIIEEINKNNILPMKFK